MKYRFTFNNITFAISNNKIYGHDPFNLYNNITPLMYLVLYAKELDYEDTKLIEFIKKNKKQLNATDYNGITALMISCKHSLNHCTENVVKILINSGANLNTRNNNGWTALMVACGYSNVNIVKYLINAGCDINLKNNQGINAFYISIYINKNSEIVKLLLDTGIDPNEIIDGKCGFEMICNLDDEEIIKYCFTKYKYTEQQLLNCLKLGKHTILLLDYLKKLYYEKIDYIIN